VPGWDVSADPILQTRLFAYGSASRYRLGINSHQLTVNAPVAQPYNPTKRDGIGYINNLNPPVQPDYIPADGQPQIVAAAQYEAADHDLWSGNVQNFESAVQPDDWKQPRELWQQFIQTKEADNFVSNVATNLKMAAPDVRDRTYSCFTSIDPDLGNRIKNMTESKVAQIPSGQAGRMGKNQGGVGG